MRFPWREGNRIELLIDGDRYFPEMLGAIQRASRSVDLEMYLFESGTVASEFIHVLTEACRRGVKVRLLLDDFGSLKLLAGDRQKLVAAGAMLQFYNPLRIAKFLNNIARDHRKIVIVDDQVAFVGGAGITDEFDPPLEHRKMWRETMVSICGPVVGDWKLLFDHVWREQTRQPMSDMAEAHGRFPVQGSMRARVTVGRGRLVRGSYQSLIRRINKSVERVWICTAYFMPSRRLRKALRRAAARGLDVRLLLPGPETDHPRVRIAGRRFYTQVLKSGVRIFEFQERVLHSKTVICDQWVSVGSSNFDRWNLRWNLEANQEVENPEFCAKSMQMLENDYLHCVEIEREAWLARPWQDRLGEWFWGVVEFWVTRVGGKHWTD